MSTAMDTLKAAKALEDAGMPKQQAEAISRVLNDIAREGLVTKEYLDTRLLQHTVATIGATAMLLGLFKIFS